jgi:hypothetical protein
MRKITLIGSLVITMYVIGFFFWFPLHIASDVNLIKRMSYDFGDRAYASWILQLDDSNSLKKLYGRTIIFWCNQFESCTVDENTGSS